MKVIPLTKGYEAIVCDCHYDLVKDYKWHYNARYAMHTYRPGGKRGTGYGRLYMHHLVIGSIPMGFEPDHINRNSLDNRCSNLRIVTPQENKLNRGSWSEARGVNQTPGGRWRARVRRNGILQYLGTYNTKEEAGGVVAMTYASGMGLRLKGYKHDGISPVQQPPTENNHKEV